MTGHPTPEPPVCEWVKWCERPTVYELELRNRAGSERIAVCRLHLAAAELYGYRRLDGKTESPSLYEGVLGRDLAKLADHGDVTDTDPAGDPDDDTDIDDPEDADPDLR